MSEKIRSRDKMVNGRFTFKPFLLFVVVCLFLQLRFVLINVKMRWP